MDDYALQQELESLAGNAWQQPITATSPSDDHNPKPIAEPISTTITRWQRLFSLSANEAVDRIMTYRNDLTRARISDEHWTTVRDVKEAEGHDRESYEYELHLEKRKAALPALIPTTGDGSEERITYLVELGGPLDSAEKIQRAVGMETVPEIVSGVSAEDQRVVELCCIDSRAKNALLKWASGEGDGYEPNIVVNPKSLR